MALNLLELIFNKTIDKSSACIRFFGAVCVVVTAVLILPLAILFDCLNFFFGKHEDYL